jgi:hypothetical protein
VILKISLGAKSLLEELISDEAAFGEMSTNLI